RYRTRPDVGASTPASASSVVVFPAPFGPSSATTSPLSMVRSSSRMTSTPEYPADIPSTFSSMSSRPFRLCPRVGPEVRLDHGRVPEDLLRRAFRDQPPEVEHGDPVG